MRRLRAPLLLVSSAAMLALSACAHDDVVVSRYGEGSGEVSHSAQESAPPAAGTCAPQPAYLVRVTTPSQTYAYRLDGSSWSPTLGRCVDSRQALQDRFQDERVCAELAAAADNPDYEPRTTSAAPLKAVQATFGAAC